MNIWSGIGKIVTGVAVIACAPIAGAAAASFAVGASVVTGVATGIGSLSAAAVAERAAVTIGTGTVAKGTQEVLNEV